MQRNWVTQKANCLEAVWVFAHTLYERKTFLIYRKVRRLYQDTWDVQLSRLCLPWSMWPHIFKVRLIMVWCYIDVVQEMCSWIINLNSAKLTVKAWADQELILSWKFSLTRIGQDAMLHIKVQLHSWHFSVEIWFSVHVVPSKYCSLVVCSQGACWYCSSWRFNPNVKHIEIFSVSFKIVPGQLLLTDSSSAKEAWQRRGSGLLKRIDMPMLWLQRMLRKQYIRFQHLVTVVIWIPRNFQGRVKIYLSVWLAWQMIESYWNVCLLCQSQRLVVQWCVLWLPFQEFQDCRCESHRWLGLGSKWT